MSKERLGADLVATVRDGTRISYRVSPGNPGRRCALVHSLAMDKSFWDRTILALDGKAEVLTIDCRGHGASDKPGGPYSVEQFAADLADVLQAEGWTEAVVAGASMGGCVALAFAAGFPGMVSALGLFDTTAWYGEGAPAAWKDRADKAQAGGMAALVGFQKTRWFSDRFREDNPALVEEAIEVFLRNDLAAYGETCAMLGRADLRAAMPGFDFPCRILVGSEDYATPPAMGQAMADAIPGASFEVMEGVRHFSPLEVPDRIAAELDALLSAAARA